jgi:hypothetical protein
MASEKLHPGPKSHALDPKKVYLTIFPIGASAPTVDAPGGVASVALSATGKFLVTLTEGYYKPISAQATVQVGGSETVDLYPQIGNFNNVGYYNGAAVGTPGQPTTFEVKLKTGTANTNIAAATQTAVFVEVVFEDTTR